MGELVDLLIELIRGANRGSWPLTLMEWARVCDAYELRLRFLDERMLFGRAAACGSTICIYVGGDDWAQILPALCHEVAECLLDREGEPAFNTSGLLSRHQVAQLVEFHYRKWLRDRK